MKKFVAVAFAGLFATAAFAQSATVTVTPEQRTRIKEYVVKQKVAPAKVPSGFSLSVGATLPEAVELHTIPQEKYSYVMVEGRTALVEPGTRKIVTIID